MVFLLRHHRPLIGPGCFDLWPLFPQLRYSNLPDVWLVSTCSFCFHLDWKLYVTLLKATSYCLCSLIFTCYVVAPWLWFIYHYGILKLESLIEHTLFLSLCPQSASWTAPVTASVTRTHGAVSASLSGWRTSSELSSEMQRAIVVRWVKNLNSVRLNMAEAHLAILFLNIDVHYIEISYFIFVPSLKKCVFRVERTLCDDSVIYDCGCYSNTYLGNGVLLQQVSTISKI